MIKKSKSIKFYLVAEFRVDCFSFKIFYYALLLFLKNNNKVFFFSSEKND